ncbi:MULTISPECIES: metal-dependent hydrolase [Haloarcula]|uniref:Membrane protein n=1 Tax=Haloarcula pellucida TaxID=1427151 RepID=A0A830GH51_9EURY|nr:MULTISPECIES: metal-dependent hydrolase [Halomicroarcula]MBX0346941.1 metal-dependent hydrolase [Halomicroarcula pellucida]MDS0277184.1 metal-dependent hydrolase [Halomicroarcula sp. S1AR25-4]GGN86183.1 membrane protein [Halomicroarcula pellucida]
MNKRGHVLNAVLLSIGLGYVLDPSGDVSTFATIAEVFLPVVLGALFPDVDTAFGKHRKTLHNLPVLLLFLAHPIYHGGNLQWVWLGVLTHYVLDYLGSRRGIALFYPLSDTEYGFPSGVTTSSDRAEIVTVAITVFELAAIAVLVHVLPQYLPPEVTRALAESTALVA